MSRSLTVRVPSARGILLGVLAVVAAIVLVGLGIRVGVAFVVGGPSAQLARGFALQEVHLVNGTVYVGHLVSDDGGFLRLADPAVVRQQTATQTGDQAAAPQFVVQALFTDPFDLSGDITVPQAQVVLVGNVSADSSLGRAYSQAFQGGTPQPTPSPTQGAPQSPSPATSSAAP